MPDDKTPFGNAPDWFSAAMQRASACNAAESAQRQQLADVHNRQENIHDPDTLADQQLYIQGKMDRDEYQDYLLFKHSVAQTQDSTKPHA
ncbi:MAG: hypothetical protein Q9M16_04785 [Mariprofundus sp.]|nr:hypothetical protein [Mariprofundus sp.]